MIAEIPDINRDQKQLWDRKHSKNDHEKYRDAPMPFAKKVLEYFPKQATILELGCGVGSDASFLAKQGCDVLATDFSKVVIDQNKEYYDQAGLEFGELDISDLPFPFPDQQFDGVYSHLGLHYSPDKLTRATFTELHRVLKDDGILAFACKSTKDSSYGVGDEIEKDVYSIEGHQRHFFTTDYAQELLQDTFDILLLQDKQEEYGDTRSAFVWCVAKKRTEQ